MFLQRITQEEHSEINLVHHVEVVEDGAGKLWLRYLTCIYIAQLVVTVILET